MDKLAVLGFLIVATALEATGDAVVRIGIGHHAWHVRCLLFLAGTALLFGYGLSLNLAPVAFGRVVGAYIAALFIVWQIVNFIVFRSLPTAPTYIGGAFIVTGGMIVTFYAR
jgi:small multidrug resistance family-3 protein